MSELFDDDAEDKILVSDDDILDETEDIVV